MKSVTKKRKINVYFDLSSDTFSRKAVKSESTIIIIITFNDITGIIKFFYCVLHFLLFSLLFTMILSFEWHYLAII